MPGSVGEAIKKMKPTGYARYAFSGVFLFLFGEHRAVHQGHPGLLPVLSLRPRPRPPSASSARPPDTRHAGNRAGEGEERQYQEEAPGRDTPRCMETKG